MVKNPQILRFGLQTIGVVSEENFDGRAGAAIISVTPQFKQEAASIKIEIDWIKVNLRDLKYKIHFI